MEQRLHKHLRRLEQVWIARPIWFITTCTNARHAVLDRDEVEQILVEERHGWYVGNYVIMPDHVHFFCVPQPVSKNLSRFVGSWKEWTSKRMVRELGFRSPVWHPEFFDHLLRSEESYSLKWAYVEQNPVRAGLVFSKDQWKFRGSINAL